VPDKFQTDAENKGMETKFSNLEARISFAQSYYGKLENFYSNS